LNNNKQYFNHKIMITKKVFTILSLALVSLLVGGSALAATTQKSASAPVQYTDAQKACIKTAQDNRMSAVRPITEALNSATKGALEAKQLAMKSAQEIKDPTAKMAAIKAANDAYNKDLAVQTARVPYLSATKEINSQFQNNLKACLKDGSMTGFFKNLFKNFGASLTGSSISNSTPSKNQLEQKPNTPSGAIAAPKYTDSQKACIKTAQDKRMATLKPATENLKNQTSAALKVRQDAIAVAQKIKDEKKRAAAIKAANDTYNNDQTVKDSKTPYMNVVKAANDQFQVDQKACLAGSGISSKGFFKNIGDGISNFGRGMMNFFTGKK
jgi:hypothetical protein